MHAFAEIDSVHVCGSLFMLYVCVSADQVYGDQEMHSTVRNLCLDYMVSW